MRCVSFLEGDWISLLNQEHSISFPYRIFFYSFMRCVSIREGALNLIVKGIKSNSLFNSWNSAWSNQKYSSYIFPLRIIFYSVMRCVSIHEGAPNFIVKRIFIHFPKTLNWVECVDQILIQCWSTWRGRLCSSYMLHIHNQRWSCTWSSSSRLVSENAWPGGSVRSSPASPHIVKETKSV